MPTALAFVDKIDPAPTTLLDLNDQSSLWLDEFDAPPPLLRRSVASTLLGDGAHVSAAAYENRELSLSWALRDNADAMATKLQAVTRQLNQQDNLLRWLPQGATAPLFFRTLRSGIATVRETFSKQGVRQFVVDVLAEPFGYGVREDLSAVAITQDPATGTNRLRADLGTVKGDVDTPAYIWRAGTVAIGGLQRLLVCEHGAAVADPPAVQAEAAGVLGSDTSVTADATASDGSKIRITFATNPTALEGRLGQLRVPADEPGMYRLYARIQVTSTDNVYQLRFGEDNTPGGSGAVGDLISYAPTFANQWVMLDLGLFQFPAGSLLRENGLTGATLTRNSSTTGFVDAARTGAGSGSLDIDFIVAIPAYGQFSVAQPVDAVASSFTTVWDGYSDQVNTYTGTGTPWSSPTSPTGQLHSFIGGLPMLSPGVTNRLWYIDDLGTKSSFGHSLSLSTTLNISYWPRYLYARPAAS